MIVHIEGSADEVRELLSKFGSESMKLQLETQKRSAPESDFLIPKFEWDCSKKKSYKTLFFFEHEDGRVLLLYTGTKTFTTRERVLRLPYPVPNGYPALKVLSVTSRTAIRMYREYFANLSAKKPPAAEKVQVDPDEKYKPQLRGVFSTHPGREDFEKVEGDLHE